MLSVEVEISGSLLEGNELEISGPMEIWVLASILETKKNSVLVLNSIEVEVSVTAMLDEEFDVLVTLMEGTGVDISGTVVKLAEEVGSGLFPIAAKLESSSTLSSALVTLVKIEGISTVLPTVAIMSLFLLEDSVSGKMLPKAVMSAKGTDVSSSFPGMVGVETSPSLLESRGTISS